MLTQARYDGRRRGLVPNKSACHSFVSPGSAFQLNGSIIICFSRSAFDLTVSTFQTFSSTISLLLLLALAWNQCIYHGFNVSMHAHRHHHRSNVLFAHCLCTHTHTLELTRNWGMEKKHFLFEHKLFSLSCNSILFAEILFVLVCLAQAKVPSLGPVDGDNLNLCTLLPTTVTTTTVGEHNFKWKMNVHWMVPTTRRFAITTNIGQVNQQPASQSGFYINFAFLSHQNIVKLTNRIIAIWGANPEQHPERGEQTCFILS